jgi:hypothetical protein
VIGLSQYCAGIVPAFTKKNTEINQKPVKKSRSIYGGD